MRILFKIKLHLWLVPKSIISDMKTWYLCNHVGHKLGWAKRLSESGEYCHYEDFPICSRCNNSIASLMEDLPKVKL